MPHFVMIVKSTFMPTKHSWTSATQAFNNSLDTELAWSTSFPLLASKAKKEKK